MIYVIRDNVSLRQALKAFHDDLQKEGLDEACFFDCKLVFSELASNAVRHGKGGEICFRLLDKQVELTLTCSAPIILAPWSEAAPVLAESGRGLYLIDSVCQSRASTSEGGIRVILKRQ